MSTVTLNCLVWGDNPQENVFTVDINEGKLVSHLKKAIKAEQPKTFANIDSKNLKLWKVDMPIDKPATELSLVNTKMDVSLKEGFPNVNPLLPMDEISECFSTPTKKHIHVIVQAEGIKPGVKPRVKPRVKPGVKPGVKTGIRVEFNDDLSEDDEVCILIFFCI
jgi:hypothetical protein